MKSAVIVCLFAWVLPAQSPAVLAALATGSYFPLDVGDRWVYRIDDRLVTGSYQTWRVDRTDTANGYTYSVIAIEGPGAIYAESWFRADVAGNVYLRSGASDLLFLDPSGHSASATLQITGTGASTSSLGAFPDTLTYRNPVNSLNLETGILVRGLGVLASNTQMLSGSSGGTTQIRTLVEATVAGAIHFPAPSPAVKLGLESITLNVSGQKVTNCAVPCYFVACYITPGADPPGTYKPCAQARVELAHWPEGASRVVRLQFRLMRPRLRYGGAAAIRRKLLIRFARCRRRRARRCMLSPRPLCPS